MDKIFQKIIENNFSDLKGMVVDATVPVPEYLINEMIQATLEGNKSIQSCRVLIYSENQVSANVKTTLFPWSINLKLKLDKAVDFDSFSSPKVRVWMENNVLLGKLGSLFNALPEGIKLYGNQLVMDINALLQASEQRRMLELVKSVAIHTEEGKVILGVTVEVD